MRHTEPTEVTGVNSPGLVRRVVAANNSTITRVDRRRPDPVNKRTASLAQLEHAFGQIHCEWQSFCDRGGRLPLTEDVLQGWQGDLGTWWRTGLLALRGRPVRPLADSFPATLTALFEMPGLMSAMFSVLGPGAELPEHRGDNAGGLRLLFGIDCPQESGHSLEGRPLQVAEGRAVLFDDTRPHAAWNRSDQQRVLILADVLRPLPVPVSWQNRIVQVIRHAGTRRYRCSAAWAAEWDQALNPPDFAAPTHNRSGRAPQR